MLSWRGQVRKRQAVRQNSGSWNSEVESNPTTEFTSDTVNTSSMGPTTRSSVRKNLSSKFDGFLAARSYLDTNHDVNFSRRTSRKSATFMRPLFAFVLCFLRQQIIKKKKMR